MRRLILFRHAKTEAKPPGVEDFDRALVARGRADAASVGAALAGAGLAPDMALVSPALRARQTWDCVRAVFPQTCLELRDGLYDATAEDIEAELGGETSQAGTVMVVGHNPGLQELAVALVEDGGGSASDIEQVAAGFPTSTAVVLRIDAAGRAALERLFHARDLRGAER